MRAHTKGPWVAIKPEGAPYWGIHTADGATVAGTSSGLSEADARMCAASPGFLALLREAGATLAMWADVAPAVGLRRDIAEAISQFVDDT